MSRLAPLAQIIFLGLGALVATDASAQALVPLVSANSMVPNALIPFRLADGREGEFTALEVRGADGAAACKLARDPFYPRLVLLKCSAPARDLMLHFTLRSGRTLTQVQHGPVSVTAVSDLLTELPPTNPVFDEARYGKGKTQFAQYCAACHVNHTNPATPRNIMSFRASDIRSIIESDRSGMGTTHGARPALQNGTLDLNALMYYINNYRGEP
ncbi:MAG TPA: hypothetical protein PLZ57_07050 [Pseudobdellovibrionaceae bacterium]|nr:hypothetical protein [Pseudobdellovibrionaceae bacterium]